jgi:hypothetical protein
VDGDHAAEFSRERAATIRLPADPTPATGVVMQVLIETIDAGAGTLGWRSDTKEFYRDTGNWRRLQTAMETDWAMCQHAPADYEMAGAI